MSFTLCCVDCGHRIGTLEDGAEGEVVCECCGSVIDYHVRNHTAAIRVRKYASLLLPHRTRILKVSCPTCGHTLASSADGTYTETICPKCHHGLAYDVKKDELYLQALPVRKE